MDYVLKPIEFQNRKLSIVTQNTNGPCPLLALCNVLLLRGSISLPDKDRISNADLVQLLAETLTCSPLLNRETLNESLDKTLDLLPSLDRGMDVNIHFTRADGFDESHGTNVFQVFGVKLWHGWLCDPNDHCYAVVSRLKTYNNVIETVVAGQVSGESSNMNLASGVSGNAEDQVMEGLVASQFLQETSSQLTYTGMYALAQELPLNDPQVFFRNNHFSTILKTDDGRLWTLVTDEGYCRENDIVWESLDVQGDSEYVNSVFIPTSVAPQTAGNDDE
jgi:hypothetical protein